MSYPQQTSEIRTADKSQTSQKSFETSWVSLFNLGT